MCRSFEEGKSRKKNVPCERLRAFFANGIENFTKGECLLPAKRSSQLRLPLIAEVQDG